MTDSPRTIGRLHKLARKAVPLRARRWFVRAVDRLAWRKREPGTHHSGGAR